jgi:hypothetical protein
MTRTSGLFWRALTAFLILPGMVAFVVPFLLRPRTRASIRLACCRSASGRSCFCGALEISMLPDEGAWRLGRRQCVW